MTKQEYTSFLDELPAPSQELQHAMVKAMHRQFAIKHIGHYIDDALSTDVHPITPLTRLVGWQCGFEPMFVAVTSYLGVPLDDDEAIELASELLEELEWFSGSPTDPDYVL